MRVLHGIVSLKPSDGGPARSVPSLASATATAGADVIVCSRTEPEIDLSAFPGVEFRTGCILEVASEVQPDVIHDHGIWLPSNHQAAKAAKRQDSKLVISTRGMLEAWCLRHHRVRKTIAWYLYQQRNLAAAGLLHATSVAEVKTIRKLGLHQPIVQLPNGVSVPSIETPVDREVEHSRLVFVGRIHPVKGLVHLLEAWSQVKPSNWTLDLYGPAEGGHEVEIQNLIDANHLSSTVRLRGVLDTEQKWRQLHAADAVVLPSFSENFGIVVAEALMVGTPVLTTTGTPWEGMLARNCGWWESPDINGMASGLIKLTTHSKEDLRAMGERGKGWMLSDFLWMQIGRNMLSSYEWLLNGDSAPEFIHMAA